MSNTFDPYNLPYTQEQEENGVILQTWGEGPPLVVIPGLEGSGESCLHFVAPAVKEVGDHGKPFQLCLVNYAAEQHETIDALNETIERLLAKTYGEQPLLVYSQSFGNLLTAKIAGRKKLSIQGLLMISPFTRLPRFMVWMAHLSMFVTPTWLYRATIKQMGRYIFGPAGTNTNHPFFEALTRATSPNVRRQTGWLVGLDYSPEYKELKVPLTIVLGRKDRLVNIEKQIEYFESLCSTRNDAALFLNNNNGHVILLQQEIRWAQEKVVHFLKS